MNIILVSGGVERTSHCAQETAASVARLYFGGHNMDFFFCFSSLNSVYWLVVVAAPMALTKVDIIKGIKKTNNM